MRLSVFLLSSLMCFSVFGSTASLLKAANHLRLLNVPLVQFDWSPQQPQTGNSVTVFLRPTTDFQSDDQVSLFLEAYLNGSYQSLLQPNANFWILQTPNLIAGEQQVQVHVFIQDESEASALRQQLVQIEKDINTLTAQILIEENETEKQILISRRNQKYTEKDQLQQQLRSLRVYIGSETLKFNVQ